MKKVLILIAAAATVLSCGKEDPADNRLPKKQVLSVPIQLEEATIEDDETKAYLNIQGSSSWNYVWEDEDQLGYFQFRSGYLYNQSLAEVDKRPYSVNVLYPSDEFIVGDAIYSYLLQEEAEAQIASAGIDNTDPYNYYMQVPTLQITESTAETYSYEENYSFNISNFSYSNLKAYSLNSSPVGQTPRSGKLAFKINGYHSDLAYRCDVASKFTVDFYGTANATLSFRPFTANDEDVSKRTSTKNVYTQVYPIKVFINDYPNDYALINLTVTATCTKTTSSGGSSWWSGGSSSTSYSTSVSYTASVAQNASVVLDYFEFGDEKPYPVRDCMPCVSKSLLLNKSLVENPTDIQSHMTMYMLGSVVEFKIYSLTSSIAVGETLEGVIFTSQNAPCAGICTYNLIGGSLMLQNPTEYTITSIVPEGLEVKNGSSNYQSIYMVLVPGTYTAEVNFVTNQNVYTFQLGEKTYSRATKKGMTINLANSTGVITPKDEFFNPSDPGDDNPGGTEGGSDEEADNSNSIDSWNIAEGGYEI